METLRRPRLRSRAARLQHTQHSLVPAFRVVEFLLRRVGVFKSSEEIAQMGRLGDDIERKMGEDQSPNVFVPGREDYLWYVGVRLAKSLQNCPPRFRRAVNVNQPNLRAGSHQ